MPTLEKSRATAALMFLAVAMAGGCGGSGSSDPFTTGTFAVRKISFTTGETEIAFAENTRSYVFRSFSIAGPAPHATIDASGVKRVIVNGVEKDTAPDQPLVIGALAPGANIEIMLQGADGTARTYTFQLVPNDLPAYTVSAQQPTPGRILLTTLPLANPQRRSFLLVLDEAGRLLAFRSNERPVADFQLQRTASGTERFTYCDWDPIVFVVKYSTGACYVLDPALRVIAETSAKKSPVNPDGVADHHELVLIEDSHYIIPAYVAKTVSNIPPSLQGSSPGARTVVTSVIQEIKDGKVIFEWDGTNFPEFYTNSVNDNDFASPNGLPEYMHLNAIAIDTDGNLLVSIRHTSQVIKVHRTTGQILWRLGGPNSDFPLAPSQSFSLQHHVRRLPDGTLTIFDNGNFDNPRVSRALSFRLDESRKVVTDFRAVGYQGIFGPAMGSAQYPAADRVFVGWGFRASPAAPDVVEIITSLGQAAFTLKFADTGLYSYRALKYPN